jgi:ribosome maturation factor RimP
MSNGPHAVINRIETLLAPRVKSLGYQLLDLEYVPKSSQGEPVLRLYIENPEGKAISFEDCAAVDHGLDEVIESAEFEALVPETFTLEVSSPGLDRPLKKPSDYLRFVGQRAQIKTYRPLTEEEMGNAKYFEHHQKQKNFFGILRGYSGDSVELETDKQIFKIPFALITKANLDVSSQLTVDSSSS